MNVLVFEVAGRRFAVPASDVQELVRAVAIVPLPGAPPIVEGVIDLRGTIVAVLDFRARFGLPPDALDPAQQLLILVDGARRVVFRIDRALGLESANDESIAAAAPIAVGSRLVAGVVALADGLAVIHDVRSFLDQSEQSSLEGALRAAAPLALAQAHDAAHR